MMITWEHYNQYTGNGILINAMVNHILARGEVGGQLLLQAYH